MSTLLDFVKAQVLLDFLYLQDWYLTNSPQGRLDKEICLFQKADGIGGPSVFVWLIG